MEKVKNNEVKNSLNVKLVEARHKAKIKKAEMAKKLLISEDKLTKIENGDYNIMDNHLYTKLLIQKYAKLVGINPKTIEEEIIAIFPENTFEKTINTKNFLNPEINYNEKKVKQKELKIKKTLLKF